MSRFTDHSFVDAKWAARPEIARILIDTAAGLGLNHQDPMVLASTSEGFRVRNDVLDASGLRADAESAGSDPEPGAGAPPAEPEGVTKSPAKSGSSKSTSRSGKS